MSGHRHLVLDEALRRLRGAADAWQQVVAHAQTHRPVGADGQVDPAVVSEHMRLLNDFGTTWNALVPAMGALVRMAGQDPATTTKRTL